MLFRKKNIRSVRPKRSVLRRLFRILLFILVGFFGIILLITGYFYFERDNIGRRVLLHTNNLAHGELSFRDISFDPFHHFPDISLLLKDVDYYENPVNARNQNEKAVFVIERLYAALDIQELIKGKIQVEKISLRSGILDLVRYPDSTMNLLNAFEPYVQKVQDPTDSSGTELDLNLEQVSLYQINIEFDDRIEGDMEAVLLKKLAASFSITPELIRSEVNADLELQRVQLSDKVLFSSKELEMETAFTFLREAGMLIIAPSILSIDHAKMSISGEIDFTKNDKFHLQVDGSDHDFSIFQLLLTDEGLKNLKQGDLYFRGNIIGVPGQEIPMADFEFGLVDVTLFVPRAEDYIRDLNLSGNFFTGSKGDLSQAILDIDTVLAELPSGHLNAAFHMENFASPEIDVMWDLEGSLSGLNKVVKMDRVDSLGGEIDTECSIQGARFDPDSNHIVADMFSLDLKCRDLSLSIADVIDIQKISGNIYNDKATTRLENLDVRTGDTDFLINGVLYDPLYLLFKVEHDIRAELQIESRMFDMPEFLSFVPAIREDFPYRIKDIDLDLVLSTSTSKMLDFETNPHMDFDIRHLDATIEDFLPRIKDLSGNFILGEKYHRTFLDFRKFEIGMLESSLLVDLEIHSPAKKRSFIRMDVLTRDLNPGEIFSGETGDSMPDFLFGQLNGSFKLDLHFPHDESTRLKAIDLQEADLHFANVRDTFETSVFNLLARDICWSKNPESKLLESLEADIQLSMDRLATDYFSLDDLEYKIDIGDGVFHVSTDRARFFAKAGAGDYTIAPFAEVPYYKLKYKVEGIEVTELLTALKTDTVLSGTMDINMDFYLQGEDKKEILSSLNGEMSLYGRDLLLYGIDLDEVIKKFKRSQNFNLVDLGAVMFAGPAGLAVSKGGNYASMLVTNFGDTSHVTEIISDWKFENGSILLRDVAFATEESRVAAQGWLDFQKDSLDISFAVIDKKGCNIIGQDLYGSIKDPEKSRIRLISTLLAPVTNLLDLALDKDCEPFYEGMIKHPETN